MRIPAVRTSVILHKTDRSADQLRTAPATSDPKFTFHRPDFFQDRF